MPQSSVDTELIAFLIFAFLLLTTEVFCLCVFAENVDVNDSRNFNGYRMKWE